MIFSIVVAAYNEEKLISNCLNSLINQDFTQPYEIIVVDNNCNDSTVNISRLFRCRIVKETQQGVIFAKQRGLLSARGKYVAFIDADSVAPPDWLNRKYHHLLKPGVVATSGFYHLTSGPSYHKIHLFLCRIIVNLFWDLFHHAIYISGSNVALHRQTALRFGGLDTKIGTGADEVDLLYKLRRYGQIHFDKYNSVATSDRRSDGGFVNFYKQILVNYCLNVLVFRLTGLKLISDYTNFR